jgi:5-methyltetrahydrofolate--homocysteine methyltransferase
MNSGIDFSPRQWDRVKQTYRRWWANELDRPIVPVELIGRDPGRPQPKAPLLSQATCADLSIPVADLVDRIDWELSRRIYLGDALPYVNMDCFGPGVMAAFLGARLDNSTGRVWFHSPKEAPIADVHLTYDAQNIWLCRVKEIYREMMRRWQGQVLVSMTDLGGNLDVASAFRPGEELLLDLYDHPGEVQRLLGEIHELWHRFFGEINAVLAPHNPGYSAWCSIYSERPYYMLQCDFSYMIGSDMFAQFVAPELAASARRLGRAIYHLDGIGQLRHLEHVLAIPGLNGVQWVPGDGQPNTAHWPEVYQRIIRAGKKTQTWDGFDALDAIIAQTGSPGSVQHRQMQRPMEEERSVRRRLGTYGIED